MIITRFRQSVLAALLAALVLTGLSPTVATAADDPQFSVSPASGRPGEPIRVTGDDPCPPIPTEGYGDMPYQDAVLTLVDSAGVSTGDRVLTGTGNEGEWDVETTIPSPHFPPPTFDASKLTPEPATGMGMLHMRCVLPDGTVAQEYAPQPFNVTGTAHRFTVSTNVDPGDAVHVESVDPCPQPYDRVQLSVSDDQYVNNLDVTPGPDGQWSADILSSYDDMGNIIPFKGGLIGLTANCFADSTGDFGFVYASTLSSVNGPAGDATCKDAVFIAVTGSGEHFDGTGNLSVSPTLKKVYSGFKSVMDEKNKTYKKRVLDYPALPVETLYSYTGSVPNRARQLLGGNMYDYLSGKTDGANALYNAMVQAKSDCPNQALVLAGYSQGALIVHQVLQKLAKIDDPVQSTVKAVVLIADPMRVPNSEVVNFGDAPWDSKGICKLGPNFVDACASEGVKDIPKRFQKMSISVCEHYDVVCDTTSLVNDMWPLGIDAFKTGITVHMLYAATPATKLAGKRVAREVVKN